MPHQEGNDDGCIVVNRKQSYRGRPTTESSSKLLTRQLDLVERQKTDNQNQRTTLSSNVKSDVRDHVRDHVRSDGRDGEPSILHFPFIYAGFRISMVGMLGLLAIFLFRLRPVPVIFTRALPIHLSHRQIAAHQNGLLTTQ